MIVKTNVKLNLGLSVLRKRADGFHDIETLFVPCFDFGDTIEIITGDDYSRSSAALFAKYGAPDGRFDASTGSVTGRLSDRQEASAQRISQRSRKRHDSLGKCNRIRGWKISARNIRGWEADDHDRAGGGC